MISAPWNLKPSVTINLSYLFKPIPSALYANSNLILFPFSTVIALTIWVHLKLTHREQMVGPHCIAASNGCSFHPAPKKGCQPQPKKPHVLGSSCVRRRHLFLHFPFTHPLLLHHYQLLFPAAAASSCLSARCTDPPTEPPHSCCLLKDHNSPRCLFCKEKFSSHQVITTSCLSTYRSPPHHSLPWCCNTCKTIHT